MVNLGLNGISQGLQILYRSGPLEHENLSSKFAPKSVELLFRIVAQRAEVIQKVGSARVIAAFKLELGASVEVVHTVGRHLRRGRRIMSDTHWNFFSFVKNSKIKYFD